MNPFEIIKSLKRTNKLFLKCPCCDEEVNLRSVGMFTEDSLTANAEEFVQQKKQEISDLKKELASLKKKRLEKVRIGTQSSNFGKLIEKFAPLLPGFNGKPEESIPLFDPIDYITFGGLISGAVNSITFIDVKSGKATLSAKQKSIKKVVEAGKVEIEIMKKGKR